MRGRFQKVPPLLQGLLLLLVVASASNWWLTSLLCLHPTPEVDPAPVSLQFVHLGFLKIGL